LGGCPSFISYKIIVNKDILAMTTEEELKYYRKNLKEGIHNRRTKEWLLTRIRDCEAVLGIPSKPYNGNGDFSNL
jgi:hypothetical protein